MPTQSRDAERIVFLRREAEKIMRELFQPDAAPESSVRLVADLLSDDDRYMLEIEVPGVPAEQLAVYALGDSLLVEGHKEQSEERTNDRPTYERAERGYGRFRRVFDLPGPADLSRVAASLRSGLLTITVPRIDDRRGRPRPIRIELDRESR